MKKVLLLSVVFVSVISCTDAGMAKIGGYGDNFKIEMISSVNGQTLRTYHSSGKVNSEQGSDGYFFMNKETGTLTEVAGGVIIITPEK